MKQPSKLTTALMLFCFSMAFANAQTGISHLHYDETDRLLLVGTSSGQLFKWSAGDTVMSLLYDNFTITGAGEVSDIIQINDSVFFVSVIKAGVFRMVLSKKSGESSDWHISNPEKFFPRPYVDALTFNREEGLLYAELSLNGKWLYLSPIDKPYWNSAANDMPDYFNSNGIVIFDGDIYSISNHRRVNFIEINWWKARMGFGLFRGSLNQNGSHEWRKIKTPDVPYHIFILNNELHILTMDGVFKREKSSWTKVFNTRAYCLHGNKQLTIALTPCQEKLWLKQTETGNWISLKNTLPPETDLLNTCMVMEHIIILATDAGLLVSDNLGKEWKTIKAKQ